MKISESRRKRIFEIIQIGNKEDAPRRAFDYFIVTVILCNIAVLFLETFDALEKWRGFFETVEIVTVLIFCVEYLLRIWTADLLYPGEKRGKAVLRFLFSFDGIVDLLTILPFFFLTGFGAFRILRVARIFHLFRINTQYDSFQVITSVIKEKKNAILYAVFIILVLILGASLCMYSVEHSAQPDKFRNALSGMWWSVSALLTVGYGDVYPITILGKTMAVIISFLGVGAVAIPTGIISAGFVEQYTKAQGTDTPFDARLTTLRVGLDSRWIGKTVSQIEAEDGVLVLIVERQEAAFRPGSGFRVAEGDVLGIYQRPHSQTGKSPRT